MWKALAEVRAQQQEGFLTEKEVVVLMLVVVVVVGVGRDSA